MIIIKTIPSSSQVDDVYFVTINMEDHSVFCSCKSGSIRGYCKHIKYFKPLIHALLHEKPGVNVEKEGR